MVGNSKTTSSYYGWKFQPSIGNPKGISSGSWNRPDTTDRLEEQGTTPSRRSVVVAAAYLPLTCGHDQTSEAVDDRWTQMIAIIEATPEDDHAAQWSVIGWCGCCCGPLKLTLLAQAQPFTAPASEFDCSRCAK